MDWKDFENTARQKMSFHFGVDLKERNPIGIPKKFDMVSSDGTIVGDAKFLTLVNGKKLPPAKFMEIAGHAWLLEKTNANIRFLVFGNQREVAEWWLEKYGFLINNIDFYFLDESGKLDKIN